MISKRWIYLLPLLVLITLLYLRDSSSEPVLKIETEKIESESSSLLPENESDLDSNMKDTLRHMEQTFNRIAEKQDDAEIHRLIDQEVNSFLDELTPTRKETIIDRPWA